MASKERLFEVFSKVTGIPLNEQDEIQDNVREQIDNEIRQNFDAKIFSKDVPYEFTLRIGDQEVPFQMTQDDAFELVDVNDGQHQYRAEYVGRYGEIGITLSVNIFVNLNPVFTYQKYEFKPEIITSNKELDINVWK